MPQQFQCWRYFICIFFLSHAVRLSIGGNLCRRGLCRLHKNNIENPCFWIPGRMNGGRDKQRFTWSWLTPQSRVRVFALWRILPSNKKTQPNLVLSPSVKHESSVTGCECRLAGRKQAFLAAVPERHWSSTFPATGSVCWLSALLVCDRLSGTGPDKEAPRRAHRPRAFLVKGSSSLPRLESYKQH